MKNNMQRKIGAKKKSYTNCRYKWTAAGLLMGCIVTVLFGSCETDTNVATKVEEGLPANIRLEVIPNDISQPQTRADENSIKDLHVFVYNASGQLVGHNYGTSTSLTVNTRSGNGYTVYAIANAGSNLLNNNIVDTETKFKAIKTTALNSWDALTNTSNVLMVGSKSNVDIRVGSNTLQESISLERCVAKITLNINAKSGSGIKIKNYQLFSLPTQSYYIPKASDVSTTWFNASQATVVNNVSTSQTFFMYENRSGINNSIIEQKDKSQTNAPANSTYVLINGEANDYDATWKVYLGENNTSDFNVKRNSQYTYNITLNRPGSVDTRVEVEETFSNCYMIQPGSSVNIPVKRANESPIELTGSTYNSETKKYIQLQPSTDWHAELVWESSIGLVSISENTGTGENGYFKVTAPSSSIEGNAVVAIKNTDNEILWSWHIWVTTYDGTITCTLNDTKRDIILMDRNLGATSSVPEDLGVAGLQYQWGRKDPFPSIGQSGGSWSIPNYADPIRVYNAEGVAYAVRNISVLNSGFNNFTNAMRNPDAFYTTHSTPYDWFIYDNTYTSNNDLWGGNPVTLTTAAKKTAFDPCPKGWRVIPWLNNTTPFKGFDRNWTFSNYGIYLSSNSEVKFAAAGMRDSSTAKLFSVGKYGYMWTASPKDNSSSYAFSFNSSGAYTLFSNFRAVGAQVRCCKQ
ncbi:MAG: DUF4906 domain-containing protein [Bacteroides sp.]|uniref:DUF4906 domain-containing protein n=1 Tax=Bacteroides sp. TaxID=29523 RepID=UPI002FCAF5FD